MADETDTDRPTTAYALAAFYRELVEEGMPEEVAADIALAVAKDSSRGLVVKRRG